MSGVEPSESGVEDVSEATPRGTIPDPWDGQPPPVSWRNCLALVALGGLTVGLLAAVVLPVVRRLEAMRVERREGAQRAFAGRPGSEPIWGVELTADVATDGRSAVNARDGARLLAIAAGPFPMGDEGRQPLAAPRHTVTLSAYWIARDPVTRARYARFLASAAATDHGGCHPYEAPGKDHTPDRWRAAEAADERLPVVGVDWFDAYAYAAWAGLRLPTEAEWERAARGTEGRPYPWGAGPPTAARAWYQRGLPLPAAAAPVDRGGGESPEGVRQLAGNVWEWCYDRFDAGYYQRSPAVDPKGPAAGRQRVVRGGSWLSPAAQLHAGTRQWRDPGARAVDLGFRCAR